VILSESHLLKCWEQCHKSTPESPSIESPSTPNLEPELKQVLEAIALECVSFDLIVQQTGLAASAVRALQLEPMGLCPSYQYAISAVLTSVNFIPLDSSLN